MRFMSVVLALAALVGADRRDEVFRIEPDKAGRAGRLADAVVAVASATGLRRGLAGEHRILLRGRLGGGLGRGRGPRRVEAAVVRRDLDQRVVARGISPRRSSRSAGARPAGSCAAAVEVGRALPGDVRHARGGADAVRAVAARAGDLGDAPAFDDVERAGVHRAQILAAGRWHGRLCRCARRVAQPDRGCQGACREDRRRAAVPAQPCGARPARGAMAAGGDPVVRVLHDVHRPLSPVRIQTVARAINTNPGSAAVQHASCLHRVVPGRKQPGHHHRAGRAAPVSTRPRPARPPCRTGR